MAVGSQVTQLVKRVIDDHAAVDCWRLAAFMTSCSNLGG
jgi:hypothetical protein